MQFTTSTLVTLAAVLSLLVSPIFALGINCRGGAACKFADSDKAGTLTGYINNIDRNRHYNNGEHIACTTFSLGVGFRSHLCAFIQKRPEGASGADIIPLAHYILEHGCKICGSVPFHFPGDNNVNNGELTYNIISSGSCRDGLC